MPLTRKFIGTVRERAQTEPEFRIGLLTEAAQCFLNGEVDAAKKLGRDDVIVTTRFERLGK